MIVHQFQIENALREVGWRQREAFPELWQLGSDGPVFSEEAIFHEWKKTLARAGRAEALAADRLSSLITMAIGSTCIVILLVVIFLLSR